MLPIQCRRRSLSIVRWATAAAVHRSAKTRTSLLPFSFAAYIAASAFLISVSPSSPSSGNSVTADAAARAHCLWPSMMNAASSLLESARPLPLASPRLTTSRSRMRNSSPPTRATVSCFAQAFRSPPRSPSASGPRRVAQRVIDVLESVQIQKQHRQLLVLSSRSGQRILQPVHEERSVRQPLSAHRGTPENLPAPPPPSDP